MSLEKQKHKQREPILKETRELSGMGGGGGGESSRREIHCERIRIIWTVG